MKAVDKIEDQGQRHGENKKDKRSVHRRAHLASLQNDLQNHSRRVAEAVDGFFKHVADVAPQNDGAQIVVAFEQNLHDLIVNDIAFVFKLVQLVDAFNDAGAAFAFDKKADQFFHRRRFFNDQIGLSDKIAFAHGKAVEQNPLLEAMNDLRNVVHKVRKILDVFAVKRRNEGPAQFKGDFRRQLFGGSPQPVDFRAGVLIFGILDKDSELRGAFKRNIGLFFHKFEEFLLTRKKTRELELHDRMLRTGPVLCTRGIHYTEGRGKRSVIYVFEGVASGAPQEKRALSRCRTPKEIEGKLRVGRFLARAGGIINISCGYLLARPRGLWGFGCRFIGLGYPGGLFCC